MNRFVIAACLAGALAGCQSNTPAPPARPAASSEPTFDVLITGGRVFDGTGAPWFRADVGIFGDRIGEIGQLADRKATLRIDASNLVVSPGFIDMLGQSEFNVLVDARAASKTRRASRRRSLAGSSIAPLNDAGRAAQPSMPFKVTLDFRTQPNTSARPRKTVRRSTSAPSGARQVRAYVLGCGGRQAPADPRDEKAVIRR
jgi:hypothetical protein